MAITGTACTKGSASPSFNSISTINLESGQKTTLSFQCPIPSGRIGTPFSGDLWIQYTAATGTVLSAEIGSVSTSVATSSNSASQGSQSSVLYVPITITNSQNVPTPAPFQQMLTIDSAAYSNDINNAWSNVEFTTGPGATGTPLQAWVESGASNTVSSTIVWVNLPSGIGANSNTVIYMNFMQSNVMSSSGPTGEAPQLSSTYGQYDNGAEVFLYYNVNPTSTVGWAISGTAGQTSSATSGSHFATTNALYANSANGDYLYTSMPSLTSNIIISYDVYTTGLGNMFFLVNSAGAGQMTRLDGRGGNPSGLATTSSWTSWNVPSGIQESADTWYKYDTIVSGTSAYAYIGSISNNLATYGTATSSSAFTIADNGNYIGLVGDALGSSYITYWNGMVIRAYPPSGAMPSASFGSVE